MKLKINKDFKENFSEYKARFNPSFESYDRKEQPIVGKLYWNKPMTVLWLYSTDTEEYYDGHQTQFGITRNGDVVWGFFSHCSCYGYEDYDGSTTIFEQEEFGKQLYAKDIPKEILSILEQRLKTILKAKKREE